MGSSIRPRLGAALGRSSQRFAAALAIAASLGGCATRTPAPVTEPAVTVEVSRYLLDPRVACAAESQVDPEAVAAHRRLIADGDVARAESAARERLTAAPGRNDWRAVLAQALLVGGRWSEVVAVTSSPPADVENCGAIAVVRGRAFELNGDPASAYGAYRSAGRSIEIATARSATLADGARKSSRASFSAAMAKGHRDAASWHLERLELWFPQSDEALRSRMELAAASGDLERELMAARALDESGAGGSEIALRRAELEIVAGDARGGLARLEKLAAAAPGDPALADALERGRFAWRLQNAPEPVRRLSRLAELSRADFAVLVYWMVPAARTARPAGGRIASDILDHPAREEIVRIVNLGLMTVDETLHRFVPGAPIRRGEALRVLLRTIRQFGAANGCGAPLDPRDSPCESAVACNLIATDVDCAPGASLSGREAIELLRGALAHAGGG